MGKGGFILFNRRIPRSAGSLLNGDIASDQSRCGVENQEMRFLFLFVVGFDELPLAVARELQSRYPDATFSGITTLPEWEFNPNRSADAPQFRPLHKIYELENQWVATPCDRDRLAGYEAMLGPGQLRRIVTADRDLGAGYWPDISWPHSPLSHLVKDPETLRRYLFGLLDFCFRTLEEVKPDIVFCDPVDNGWKLGLSLVCRHLGIPFATLTHARLDNRWIVDDSPENLLSRVRLVFDLAVEDRSIVEPYLSSAQEYVTRFREKPQAPDTFRMVLEIFDKERQVRRLMRQFFNAPRLLASLSRKRISIRNPRKLDFLRHRVVETLRSKWLKRCGPFRALGDLPKGPFAYFPLHFEPEAATQIAGHLHTNQVAVIEALTKSLPAEMDLVVKDHAIMLGRRPLSAYTRLKGIPGVVLASPFENSLSLIQRAALTCVITGTAAWEAMLLGRPAVFIGDSPFFAVGSGFVHCPDLSSLPGAVNRALAASPADDERLAIYIAAILRESFELEHTLFVEMLNQPKVAAQAESVRAVCDGLLKILHDS